MPHKIDFDKGGKQKIARAIFWLIFAFCVFSMAAELIKTKGAWCPVPPAGKNAVMENKR
jgi:hypothetical protein